MNSQAARAARATKQISVFADLEKRVASTDEVLLRRWERIAKEIVRD